MVPKHRLKGAMLQDIVEMETMLTEILETEQLRSHNGKLSLKPLDIGAVAADLVKKYRGRKPGVKLLALPRDLRINADEARVRTVLQNVLENALKYSAQQKRPVQVSVEAHKTHVVVNIQDFGVGIPDDEQEMIFEPFYRVDKSRTKKTGGYGLGLSLCREIMQAHDGEITLQSKVGKGTNVVLKFPK
jgi:signal transduction histidine kinase